MLEMIVCRWVTAHGFYKGTSCLIIKAGGGKWGGCWISWKDKKNVIKVEEG